ncbi:hypothetical protein BCR44DRAFT_1438272 [Catenaria anguillulae PL171]|uniref:Uncharacterized protein n=1 Tax=Catenaria anguillulae PL171 TaxID=765915 RepID=A0A1Y2HFH6_9FUNG|nr:hypothetical protein BCR44DRAFT_1438272 [Catenaria anguillulae PL171]
MSTPRPPSSISNTRHGANIDPWPAVTADGSQEASNTASSRGANVATAASSAESTPRVQTTAGIGTGPSHILDAAESRASLSSSSASTTVPPFGRNRSAAATVVSIATSDNTGTDVTGAFGTPPAVPMLPPSLSHGQDCNHDERNQSRPTTASTLLSVERESISNRAPRSRYTTAATSSSGYTAVHQQDRAHPNMSGDWSPATHLHTASTPRAPPGSLATGTGVDANGSQTATMSHSPSSATITLFDTADAIRPAHPLSAVAEHQPLAPHKTTTAPMVTTSSNAFHDHSSNLKQVGSTEKNDLPLIYTRLCPYPPAQKLIPRTRTRRIVCCVFLLLLILVLSIGIYVAVTLSSLVPPKLDVLRTSAPAPPRQPVSIDTNGPVVTIQWDLVVAISNANSIPIELYDIRFAGYTSPNTTQVPLASGNLTTMALPARSNSTTPSRSEWLVPVTIPWRVRDSTQNGFLVNLLTACNAPKALVPSGATVKPGDKVKLWYTVDAGVERLKWFAGGYRHKHEVWAEFACPVNLAEVPGMKEIASVVGTVTEVVGGLLQNGTIPNVRLPQLPSISSLFGQ